jgi:hypothetical protein
MQKRLFVMCAFALLASASLFSHAQAPVSVADIRAFELTPDALRAYREVNENLFAAMEENPRLLAELEDEDEDDLDEEQALRAMISIFESEPAARRAVESAGISVREFALINATLIPAYIAVQMRQAGFGGEVPDYLSPQHIQFAEQNGAEIEALFELLQAMAPDDDDDW